MQGHGVIGVVIDTFDNVDFAFVRLHKSAADTYKLLHMHVVRYLQGRLLGKIQCK